MINNNKRVNKNQMLDRILYKESKHKDLKYKAKTNKILFKIILISLTILKLIKTLYISKKNKIDN